MSLDNCNHEELDNSQQECDDWYKTPGWELTEEEEEGLCRAFTLFDTEADGVIDPKKFHELLISWGRLPMDEELAGIMAYTGGMGCEGTIGMDFDGFRYYVTEQLVDTQDETRLREAFQVFDSSPPTGKLNLAELRHYLKHTGLRLADDEIDFLFREDYWMLEEKSIFEYEQLINKILDKQACDSTVLKANQQQK